MIPRSKPANVRDELDALTPRLRRYARALSTGSPSPSEPADDLVHATLMRALVARTVGSGDLAIRLYATVTQLHRDLAATDAPAGGDSKRGDLRLGDACRGVASGRPALVAAAPTARQTKMSAGLLSLPLEAREALLLVALEGFEHGEAARILRISRGLLVRRLTQARSALVSFMQVRPAKVPDRDVPYLRLVH